MAQACDKPATEIRLNNKGASLLERRRYESAVAAFTAAIKLLVSKRLRRERMGRAIAATFKATAEGSAANTFATRSSTLLRSSQTNRSRSAAAPSLVSSKKQGVQQQEQGTRSERTTKKPLELIPSCDASILHLEKYDVPHQSQESR